MKMFDKLKLGIFGYCIATKCNNGELGRILLIKCIKSKRINWDFNNHNEFDTIVKKRTII